MKINLRIILTLLISFLDDVIIIALIILGLSYLGIRIPVWSIAILALILGAWSWLGYWGLKKNPSLGFENMVGKTGCVVELIKRKGTIRIDHEIWQATSQEDIESGTEVKVIGQSGLKLTVIRKQGL